MVEEDNSPIKENLEGDNEILAEEAQEVTELIETIEESDELVAEYAPEESLENEDESMVAAAAEEEEEEEEEKQDSDCELLRDKIKSIRKIKLEVTEESKKYMSAKTKRFYAAFDAISGNAE